MLADFYRLSRTAVKRIDQRHLEQEPGPVNLRGVTIHRHGGVCHPGETSLRRVIVEPSSRRMLWVVRGRSREACVTTATGQRGRWRATTVCPLALTWLQPGAGRRPPPLAASECAPRGHRQYSCPSLLRAARHIPRSRAVRRTGGCPHGRRFPQAREASGSLPQVRKIFALQRYLADL